MNTTVENSRETFIRLSPRAQKRIKTTLCRFFLEKTCTKGVHCNHAHSPEELRERILSPPYGGRLCLSIINKGSCSDSNCGFSHSLVETRVSNPNFKTKMCDFMMQGHCKTGLKCRFAHSAGEVDWSRAPEMQSVTSPLVAYSDDFDYRCHRAVRTESSSSTAASLDGYQAPVILPVIHSAPVMWYPYAPQPPLSCHYED
jgi:hypothetical protein